MDPEFSSVRATSLANMVNMDHQINPDDHRIPQAYNRQNSIQSPNQIPIHPNPIHQAQFMKPLPPTIVKEINELIHLLTCKYFRKLKLQKLIDEFKDAKTNNIWPIQLSLQQKYIAEQDQAQMLPTLIDCLINKNQLLLNELEESLTTESLNQTLSNKLAKYSTIYDDLDEIQIKEFAELCFKTKKAQFIYKQSKDAESKQIKQAAFEKRKEANNLPVVVTNKMANALQSKITNLTKQIKQLKVKNSKKPSNKSKPSPKKRQGKAKGARQNSRVAGHRKRQ